VHMVSASLALGTCFAAGWLRERRCTGVCSFAVQALRAPIVPGRGVRVGAG